jgi:hypothetical protein
VSSTPPTQPLDCRFLAMDISYRLLVYGSGAATGQYGLHVWQLTDAAGCTDLGQLPGAWRDPLTGQLSDATDEDCYAFTVPLTQSAVTAHAESSDPADPPVLLQIVNRDHASVLCSTATGVLTDCPVQRGQRYALIVGDSDAARPMAGTYTVTRG